MGQILIPTQAMLLLLPTLTTFPQFLLPKRGRSWLAKPKRFRSLPAKRRRNGVGIYKEGCPRCGGRCSCLFESKEKRNGKILPITAPRSVGPICRYTLSPVLNVDLQSAESAEAFEAIFSQSGEILESQSNVTSFLSSIRGL